MSDNEVQVLTREEWVEAMVQRGMPRHEAEEIVAANDGKPFPLSRAEGARRGFLIKEKRDKKKK
ncbi:MAG: hypothetical protein WDZ40_03615 [Candidatus Spechtbacterales bacterium]